MITEVIDLERLLDQYDSGAVLIGPLLRLSLKSSYRYFYIAGKGGDVYQATLGLGVIKSEAAAQRQRADVIKKLEGRFAEVLSFDGDVAMLQASPCQVVKGEDHRGLDPSTSSNVRGEESDRSTKYRRRRLCHRAAGRLRRTAHR